MQILPWCRSLHDYMLVIVEVKQKKLKSARLISKLLELCFLDEVQTVLSQSDITKPHYLQEINLSMHAEALLTFHLNKSLWDSEIEAVPSRRAQIHETKPELTTHKLTCFPVYDEFSPQLPALGPLYSSGTSLFL